MAVKELIFVTSNVYKYREFQSKMKEFDITSVEFDIVEIQGTQKEIARHKVLEAFKVAKKPCFVEDVSLEFGEWKGLPGPYIKQFVKTIGVDHLPSLLKKDFSARAICTIAYAHGEDDVHFFQGMIDGTIVEARKDNGFAFDRIFLPNGEDETFSEMDMDKKNRISHRARAIEKFKDFLKNKEC